MLEIPSGSFGNEVLYKVEDHVAVITLNAPERLNTMSADLNLGMITVLEVAAEDPDVHVIVLTGAGKKAFCAGGNLQADESGQSSASAGFRQRGEGGIPPTMYGAARTLRSSMNSSQLLRENPKITIAAINGACAGAGMSWACACDLRFASDNALFRTAFLTAGLSGDYGGTWTLPRIVGTAKAKELYMLNRKVGAQEAQRIGLCSEVFEQDSLMDEVMKIAKELASAPQLALRRVKMNLNESDENLSFSKALDNEADRHARTGAHPDAKEAGIAFMAKRPPKFQGVGNQKMWQSSKL